MRPLEALKILDKVVAEVSLTRRNHEIVKGAVDVLYGVIKQGEGRKLTDTDSAE